MEAKAVARYVRIAPRKARVVMDLIRESVQEAMGILRFMLEFTPDRESVNISVANAQKQP